MTIRHTSTKPLPLRDAVMRPMPAAETTSSVSHHTFADRLLRLPEVARTIGVSRATIYRYVDSGRLPRPVKAWTRCIAWSSPEINARMAALRAA